MTTVLGVYGGCPAPATTGDRRGGTFRSKSREITRFPRGVTGSVTGSRFALRPDQEFVCAAAAHARANRLTQKPTPITTGTVALAGLRLRSTEDLVSLRRRVRGIAEQFGLGGPAVRSFCTATSEAARLLFAQTRSGTADVSISPASELQITIRVTPGEGETLVGLEEELTRLRTVAERVTLDRNGSSLAVTLAMRLPSTSATPAAPAPPAPEPAVAAPVPDTDLVEENVRLRRRLLELQQELEDTNRGVVALYAEIDEQTEKLRQANRAKEDFLATLSHELRTPLNAMIGWTRLMRMGKLEPAAMSRALETIERNAHVQEQLVADILDLSRIVTGKLRIALRPIELEPIVDAAIDALQPTAAAKNVYTSRTVARVGTVMGDPDRLQQVIWNLLANAIKFTPAGGRVHIELSRSGPHAVITVTDTGEGIPPALLPFIFDRFTQGDASATRLHGGLGLGLSIVRHIVELHGGEVRAESEGPGRGATFRVMLPVRAIQQPSDHAFNDQPLVGLKVLVVDDDADAREVVSMALAQSGARTAAASSVREALQILTDFKPDVLVSDIAMPGEDGLTLIRRVRALGDGLSRVPAIALTGVVEASDKRRVLTAGFQQFVPKPVESDELAAIVRDLARSRR